MRLIKHYTKPYMHIYAQLDQIQSVHHFCCHSGEQLEKKQGLGDPQAANIAKTITVVVAAGARSPDSMLEWEITSYFLVFHTTNEELENAEASHRESINNHQPWLRQIGLYQQRVVKNEVVVVVAYQSSHRESINITSPDASKQVCIYRELSKRSCCCC